MLRTPKRVASSGFSSMFDLHHPQAVLPFGGDFLEQGRNGTARAAPLGPEITSTGLSDCSTSAWKEAPLV